LRSGNPYWAKAMLAADNLAAPVEPLEKIIQGRAHRTSRRWGDIPTSSKLHETGTYAALKRWP
jgi:hypothetical protein